MASPAWQPLPPPGQPSQAQWSANQQGQLPHSRPTFTPVSGYPAPPYHGPSSSSSGQLPVSSPVTATPPASQHNQSYGPAYRWQPPSLGPMGVARPIGDVPLLGPRPPMHSSGTNSASYQAYPAMNPWMTPTHRPPFQMYSSGFQMPYQGQSHLQDGMAAAPYRHLGEPLQPGVWGNASSGSEIKLDEKDVRKLDILADHLDSWMAHKTEDGTVYYYNSVSGESTYDKPAGFKGEAAKVAAQPTAVRWEKIQGTDWGLVVTNDDKKYFVNTKTQATSWQVPPEIVEIRKKQMDEGTSKTGDGSTSDSLTPAAVTGGREAQKASSSGITALDLVKRKLQDYSGSMPITISTSDTIDANTDKQKGNSDKTSSDSSSDSEDEGPSTSKEERISQFKEMLKEYGIAPFSKWERELPKVIFDPRFKAIPSHSERRSIFEHYVRTRADEERKEKRAAQKAAFEAFRQLLDEAAKDISHSTTYESFAKVWSQDPRFEALDRKERETLLNERVSPLRKAEDERLRAIFAAAAEGFKAMLKERGDITTTTRWSKVKDQFRNDARYKAVRREERENIFGAYIADLRAAEQEIERAAKAKRAEEEKIREKERELRKRKEREELELDRVRAKARRKDAVSAYQALLTEKIKDPEASWTESRPKLEKDPLGRAMNPELDLSDRERLFRDHVKELYERCEKEYRTLLADVVTVDAAKKGEEEASDILTSWTEAKKLLKSDHRYNRMPHKMRECWWRRYAEDVQRRLKLLNNNNNKDGKDGKDGRTHQIRK